MRRIRATLIRFGLGLVVIGSCLAAAAMAGRPSWDLALWSGRHVTVFTKGSGLLVGVLGVALVVIGYFTARPTGHDTPVPPTPQ